MIEKTLLEHCMYLQSQGLNNIEIFDEHITGIHETNRFNIYLTISEDKPEKIYHATSVNFAMKILEDGYIKGGINYNNMNYGKVFFSETPFYWRRVIHEGENVIKACPIYKLLIVFEFDSKSRQLYNFINNIEWFTFGNMSIADSKIYVVYEDNGTLDITKDQLNEILYLEYKKDTFNKLAIGEDLTKDEQMEVYTQFNSWWNLLNYYRLYMSIPEEFNSLLTIKQLKEHTCN